MAPKFVPRERKHRKIARRETQGAAPSQGAGKKQKRLEKYLETKLKKEQNLDLLKKLAAQKVDTSLFQSAKTLGRIHENKRERLQRALRERNAGIDVYGDQDTILFEERGSDDQVQDESGQDESGQDESGQDESGQDQEEEQRNARSSRPVTLPTTDSTNTTENFGLGLRRPLDIDDDGQAIIKRRKRRKVTKTGQAPRVSGLNGGAVDTSSDSASEESEWNGFESGVDEDDFMTRGGESASHNSHDGQESDLEYSSATSSEHGSESSADKSARVSAFKAWANSQRNEALDFTPSSVITDDAVTRASFKPRSMSPDPDAVSTAPSQSAALSYRPATAITVVRSEEIQKSRLELPVVQDEQRIVEAIHGNPSVVICGATGSGKTTQIPQLLLENGYAASGMIGITQPRRVAATSVASRVATELGDEWGNRVGHQVRYDSSVRHNTAIKFMTDGVLLREISQDFVLSKYSVLVIDEAHERSVNTDILIGTLSRIVPLRQELSQEKPDKYCPLKLIIMSATLRVTDFLMNNRLFKSSKPPLVQVEGRQHQVTEHFARRTQRDFVAETVRKVSKGHRKLPQGGILVFLTGQDEIQHVAKQLRETFRDLHTGFNGSFFRTNDRGTGQPNDFIEAEDSDSESDAEIQGLDDYDEDNEFAVDAELGSNQSHAPLKAHILPLYAALPSDQQRRVFEPVADGCRAIILATNVAETSLTIPGIRYVFDCGRSKEKVYDTSTGVQEYKIDWISKASAAQRMGRAGRTGPGHCYRLYSSAIFEQYFKDHQTPEILRSPIEGTVLQLKSMDIDNIVEFPFPTPPRTEQLIRAEQLLQNLGATNTKTGTITEIGRELTYYPVNPRFGKMLVLGLRNKVLPLTIALVAGLAVGDLFVPEPRIPTETANVLGDDHGLRDGRDIAALNAAEDLQKAYRKANAILSMHDEFSDAMKVLTAVAAHATVDHSSKLKSFCAEYFLREKSMAEVQQLRRQIHHIMAAQVKDARITAFEQVLPAPSKRQISLLKQIVAGGYIDQVAIRADLLPSAVKVRPGTRAIEVPYRTILPTADVIDQRVSIEEQEQLKCVYIHPSSVLAKMTVSQMPPYIVYSELTRATANAVGAAPKRTRMRALTNVQKQSLATLAEATPLLEIGKPIGNIKDMELGRRRECWVGVALRDPNGAGSTGWPLGAWKVEQVRRGGDWTIEKVISRGEQ